MFAATGITTHKIGYKQFFHGANTNASQSNVASKEVDTKKLLTLTPSRHVLNTITPNRKSKEALLQDFQAPPSSTRTTPNGED